ncbi:MAG: hypothetical protein WC371_01070 [Parachlamydiales bacterium]|jgi:hypothetical protein
MPFLIFLFASQFFLPAAPAALPAEEKALKTPFSTFTSPSVKSSASSELAASASSLSSLPALESKTKSVLAIDAKKRAEDYLKAYELMRKEKPSSKIFFKLANGSSLQNIVDLVVLENGTLILFKTTTSQGLRYEIVPIEEIVLLSHL